MTIGLFWAVLAGHLVFAQHEFADRSACNLVAYQVAHQLRAEGAEKISVFCLDEPST